MRGREARRPTRPSPPRGRRRSRAWRGRPPTDQPSRALRPALARFPCARAARARAALPPAVRRVARRSIRETTTLVVPSRCSSLPAASTNPDVLTARRQRSTTGGGTIRLIVPCSSSSSMKTTPLAVAGRWRATTIPATPTRVAVPRPSQALAGQHIAVTAPRGSAPSGGGRASSRSSCSRQRSAPRGRAAAAAGVGDPSSASASCAPSSVRAARAEPPASQRAARRRSSSGSTGASPVGDPRSGS